MTETFEVGDRVECVRYYDNNVRPGENGAVSGKSGGYIRVRWDDNRNYLMLQSEIKHVTTTKGDIVATATKTTREVTETRTITETVKVPTITLELNQEEAQTLADITSCVSGSTTASRRKYTDRIADALRTVGVDRAYPKRDMRDNSDIYFKDSL